MSSLSFLFDSSLYHHVTFLGEWNGICNEFQKMLFVRSLRTDRVSFCITNFIVNQLGPQFVEPPVLGIIWVLLFRCFNIFSLQTLKQYLMNQCLKPH